MFNEHPKEGETPSFKGSALMVVAEDEQQVRRLLEEDVYSKNGVWDLENTQIIPVCYFSGSPPSLSYLIGILE